MNKQFQAERAHPARSQRQHQSRLASSARVSAPNPVEHSPIHALRDSCFTQSGRLADPWGPIVRRGTPLFEVWGTEEALSPTCGVEECRVENDRLKKVGGSERKGSQLAVDSREGALAGDAASGHGLPRAGMLLAEAMW